MALQLICSLAQLPPGEVQQLRRGEAEYAVCNVAGEVRVLEGTCPHAGAPLGEGHLEGEWLICPWHAWAFHSGSGEFEGATAVRLATYPVVVEGGLVYLAVADHA